jgi:hypothetical protein
MNKSSLMGSLRLFRVERGRRLAILAVFGFLGAACSPQSPEEQIKAYNKELGLQGEYTGTHLIIRWPALRADDKPTTLSIPREYLDSPPVFKDEAGGVDRVYLNVALPDATAWQPIPRVKDSDPPEKRAAAEKHRLSRKFVQLHRSRVGSVAWRNAVRREGQGERIGYSRDGWVGDLERYSPMLCREGDRGAATHEFVAGKEPDDPSPPHCRRNRASAVLVSPETAMADNEGVAIDCSSTGCAVYFVGGRRGVRIDLEHAQVPHWRQFVEPIRKRIDSFIVD